LRQKERISLPYSRLKEGVSRVFKDEGYVADVQVTEEGGRKTLHVYLRYDDDHKPIIRGLRKVSRPGRRVFRGVDGIGKVLDGLGVSVLTTSQGVMSDRRARKERVGGEVLCKIW
ncbi:MAG: 30S ribosomal protein S8, partial [Planctomycetota bacterium]